MLSLSEVTLICENCQKYAHIESLICEIKFGTWRLCTLAVFLKKLFERPSVFLFMIGKCQYCILQSGELQIKQNLMPKIEPAKLTTKMQLIDL